MKKLWKDNGGYALIYVLINLLTDLLQPVIDPRLREGGASDER